MALDYGPQELDRHIPSLARNFKKFADDNFKFVESLTKYEKLAIAEKFFTIELTDRSVELFVKLTDEYLKIKED
jgi:hypothetical protein